jgi:hypothetical protein
VPQFGHVNVTFGAVSLSLIKILIFEEACVIYLDSWLHNVYLNSKIKLYHTYSTSVITFHNFPCDTHNSDCNPSLYTKCP